MRRVTAAAALYASEPVVFQFMAAFARFEFSLKNTKHLKPSADAKPFWEKFEKQITREFEALLVAGGPTVDMVLALLQEPPRNQKVVNDLALTWSDSPLDSAKAAGRAGKAGLAVRRIRNNLFHGGKDLRGRSERDLTLIHQGMAVLELMLEASPELAASFEAF